MATVITRSNHPDGLWPGVLVWFGEEYDQFPTVYDEIFDEIEGQLATERLVAASRFGLAQIKTESAPIAYDSDNEDYVTLATPYVTGLGFAVTEEELEDQLYAEVSEGRAEGLANSMRITAEFAHANVFVNGFSNSFVYGDGQPLFSATHPSRSGSQSNVLTVPADFSEIALEDLIKQIYLTTDSRGLPINLRPRKIIVSANDMFNTTRVLASQLQSNTANNNINALKHMELIPEGAVVNPYFGVETGGAWYLQTSIKKKKGLVSIWRRRAKIQKDGEFDTGNAKTRATQRFIPSVGDWRSIFASNGP